MARHTDRTTGWLWVLPALLIPLAVAAVAWTGHVASEGEAIAPNVRFAGIDISGLPMSDATDHVETRQRELLDTRVTIDLGERDVTMSAGEIGFDYLYNETVSHIVSARHEGGPVDEFISWTTTPFATVTIDDRYVLDRSTAYERLGQADFVVKPPVEPQLSLDDSGQLTVIPGSLGIGVNSEQIVADLQDEDLTAGNFQVTASYVSIPPQVDDTTAEALADEVNRVTRRGFLAIAGDQSASLTPEQVRRHVRSTVADGEISVGIDTASFHEELERAFPEPIGELIPPRIEVSGGAVVLVAEGEPPPICCSFESVRNALDDYLRGGPTWYVLDTRPTDDETLVAWADGSYITEPVAEFTTNHACCENRVVNIQTMADTLTGKYLIPGETLSLNEFVGRRTREKGYLPAGAIRGGHMTDEVGGGVSQFVTTLFNAAFFAGLDLDEYQSHTVYFSRYPFGREATLSMPGPDLVITNNTAYPVLIWPTYTDTSITVTIYSTPNVEVVELDQRVGFRNQCRHSQIDRQRTFSDGRVVVDTIVANYRPGNGIDCNGNRIPQS